MTQLEEIYLMNVALYIPSYVKLVHFMQINKKCTRTIHRLKRTPYFDEQVSYVSFLKRFYPETIDYNGSPMSISIAEEKCSVIRNPSFIVEGLNETEINKVIS